MKHIILLFSVLFVCATVSFGQAKKEQTVFKGDFLKIKTEDEKTRFYLTGNVVITGTNLKVTCDSLEALSVKVEGQKSDNDVGNMEEIIATGNVHIIQDDRDATAGRAEIYPMGFEKKPDPTGKNNGVIVLKISPVLRDLKKGTVASAHEIRFHQGKGEAEFISAPDKTERPTVILDEIPDLGGLNDNKKK